MQAPKKKSPEERKRQTRRLQAFAVAAAVLAAAGYGFYQYRLSPAAGQIDRPAAAASGQGSAESGPVIIGGEDNVDGWTEAGLPSMAGDTVAYQGKTYKRNTYVRAILCAGVDRKGSMEETTNAGDGGQTDGIFLVAQDTARGQLEMLLIPRDTMTRIMLTDLAGNELGRDVQHLNLAFAYGDGREKSCEYMTEAVSGLFGGFPIDACMAADIEVINILNDAVGGVTVTVPDDGALDLTKADPAFTPGAQVTLQGEQAEKFVRWRDTTVDYSAIYRMARHQEYMRGFLEAAREKSKTDPNIVPELADLAESYLVTDMPREEYLKIGVDALAGEAGITFRTLPGESVTTELYDEFHADYEGAAEILLEMFYREA